MKKIMFNDHYGLTQAVLEGCKTQTRRLVPQKILDMVPAYQEEYYAGALESISVEDAIYNITHGEKMAKAPFYVGEEVAIAQSYRDVSHEVFLFATKVRGKEYRKGWGNKMFVRADFMPHRIKITDVRVERLQDIIDEDCLKEGVIQFQNKDCDDEYGIDDGSCFTTARIAFAFLIDKVSGKGTWDSNPWVFVYEFELVK